MEFPIPAEWTEKGITDFLQSRKSEDKHFECKAFLHFDWDLNGYHSEKPSESYLTYRVIESIMALANAEGGLLFFGVAESRAHKGQPDCNGIAVRTSSGEFNFIIAGIERDNIGLKKDGTIDEDGYVRKMKAILFPKGKKPRKYYKVPEGKEPPDYLKGTIKQNQQHVKLSVTFPSEYRNNLVEKIKVVPFEQSKGKIRTVAVLQIQKSRLPIVVTEHKGNLKTLKMVIRTAFKNNDPYKDEQVLRYITEKAEQEKYDINLVEKLNQLLDKANQTLIKVSTNEIEKAIATYHAKLKSTSVFESLEKIFTHLTLEEFQDQIVNTDLFNIVAVEKLFDLDEAWSNFEDKDWPVNTKDNGYILENTQERRQEKVMELFDRVPRLVLLGEPGGGKTTSLQRFCLSSLMAYHPGGIVTVYVPLAAYHSEESLKTLICRASNFSMIYLDYLLNNGRITLLLDALNECQLKFQEDCIKQIRSLLTSWPELPFVLTARTHTWQQQLKLPTFKIQPLSKEQQECFLGAYLGDIEQAKTTLEELYLNYKDNVICNNPFMLRIISGIIPYEKTIPKRRALIFRRYFQLWYRRESDKAHKRKSPLPWEESEVIEKLSYLATHFAIGGYFKQSPFSWIIKTLGDEWEFYDSFFKQLGHEPFFIVNEEDDTFSFFHESFQEYLLAENFVRNPEAFESLFQEREQRLVNLFKHVYHDAVSDETISRTKLRKFILDSDLNFQEFWLWCHFIEFANNDELEAVYEAVIDAKENLRRLTNYLNTKMIKVVEKHPKAWVKENIYLPQMFLIYAFELEKNPSKEFIKTAWKLDPFLTALMVDDTTPLQQGHHIEKWSPFMIDILSLILNVERLLLKGEDYSSLQPPTIKDLTDLSSPSLRYLINSNPIAIKRLNLIKKDLQKRPQEQVVYFKKFNIL